ncbi:Immunoglobulin I-set [Trinorchestia longiramus]|nr:Immunoglobulin I-set [Trinorchestia longiramus]
MGTDRTLQGYNRYSIIGSEGKGEWFLNIRTLLVSDDAEYQCQVGAAEGEPFLLSKKAKVTVHVPPKNNEDMVSIDRPSPITATAGDPIRLSCMARFSKPAATIEWYKGDQKIKKGTKSTTLELPNSSLVSVRNTLDLTPDSTYDNTNLTCHVEHVALDEPIIRSVLMTVKYPPTVEIAADSVKITEGDDVQFTCTAEGNPSKLVYRWEVGGITVEGADQGPEYTLKNVSRKSHESKVACFVTNDIDTTSAEHTLVVEYSPVFNSEPVDVDAELGKSVNLTCDVDGNPSPEIVWTHKGSEKVIHIGATKIVTVSPATVGTYSCRATVTGFPEVWRSMEVFMRGTPTVLPGQSYFGATGGRVEVQCVVDSLPRPSSLTWSRDGKIIYPNDQKYNIQENPIPSGVVNTLTILHADVTDFGAYNCTANNTFGSDTATVQLLQQQPLPLITTLVAIIGAILFLILVVAAIVLFRRKGLEYKDPGTEKHGMHDHDRSSTNDSMLKMDTQTGTYSGTYTGTASDLTPSECDDEDGDENDDDFTNEDWESTNLDEEQGRRPARPYQFPLGNMNLQMNSSGTYVPFDYRGDYSPPPPPPPPLPANYHRNTIYTSVPLNNFGPGLPGGVLPNRNIPGANATYVRVPTARGTYGSSGALAPQNSQVFVPSLGPPNTDFGANVAVTNMNFGSGVRFSPPANMQNMTNNLNIASNAPDKNAIYSQLGRVRNIRPQMASNNQYITAPQNDLGRGGSVGTHI